MHFRVLFPSSLPSLELLFDKAGDARVGALGPPEPHGHDDGDRDDEPHKVEDDDELDEVDGGVGH